jgi:hypothetical protein
VALDLGQVLRRRVSTQHLLTDKLGTAAEVVSDLVCVQSQEAAHALWSLGCRTQGLRYADVLRELDDGRFLRTHILRPTWHFVAAADIRWLLALTSPRVQRRNLARYRQLGLDQQTLGRAGDLIADRVAGARYATRRELGEYLQQHGLAVDGQRLAYLVMHAELEAVVCSGPMAGSQPTYALLDERVPAAAAGDVSDPLAELVFRFFSGHGPASVADLVRWSSLPAAAVREGLDLNADRLERDDVAGETLWSDPKRDRTPLPPSPRVLLLPLYDELVLTYKTTGFPAARGHPHPPGERQFVGPVVVDEANVGTWRRTIQGTTVRVETSLTAGVSTPARSRIASSVAELGRFLDLPVVPAAPGGACSLG